MVEPFRLHSVSFSSIFTHITGQQRRRVATVNIGLATKKARFLDGYISCSQQFGKHKNSSFSLQVEQGIDQFTKQLLHMDSPSHNKLTRSFANDGPSSPVPNPSPKITTSTSLLHGSILNHLRQLMSTCLILRLGDFLVYRVTTAKSRQTPKEFIVGE